VRYKEGGRFQKQERERKTEREREEQGEGGGAWGKREIEKLYAHT